MIRNKRTNNNYETLTSGWSRQVSTLAAQPTVGKHKYRIRMKKSKDKIIEKQKQINNFKNDIDITEYKKKQDYLSSIRIIVICFIVGFTIFTLGIIKIIKNEYWFMTAKYLNAYTPFQLLIGIFVIILAIILLIKLIIKSNNMKNKNE